MKKLLSILIIMVLLTILTGGYFVWERYQSNPDQIVPYPYTFQEAAPSMKPDAPIVIIGDRMGFYFAKFYTTLAETISVNLAKPIKIQSIAKPGFAIHRTLHELKSLTQWPQILIYQGGSEEFSENKFVSSEILKIKNNFSLYQDDKIETILILYPWLSRLLYQPIKRVSLVKDPVLEAIDEAEYLKRLETELLLFEQHLIQLVMMSKDRNTLLILTTTPINLDQPPRRVCEFTTNSAIEGEIAKLRELLRNNNPKEAYTKSAKLVTQHTGNAELFYIHGQIAKRLGKQDEAVMNLLAASAYDCEPWRITEVHNSIIRKIAKRHQVLLFDFSRLLENDFAQNTTFFDEIHPQNLYYDKGMTQLGMVIKSILKL